MQGKARKRSPCRELDLRPDKVYARHFLRDGVLDLKAGVGLHEDEAPLPAGATVQQELKRAEGMQPADSSELDRSSGQAPTDFGRQARRRRDLYDLLVAALKAALALIEVADIAGCVGDDLDLDMACIGHELLNVDGVRPKRSLRLGACPREGVIEFGFAVHGPHAAPAASSHRLDHHGTARTERRKKRPGFLQRCRALGPQRKRNSSLFRQTPRRALVPEKIQCFGSGTDEDNASGLAGAAQF
ncbi:hypothetical protein D9M72_256730 [compost metagenome]